MDISEVISALEDAISANKSYEEARDGMSGYGWHSYGGFIASKRDDARAKFGDTLERFIDARAMKILQKSKTGWTKSQ